MDTGSPEAVKTLFSRCLLTCLDVDLWRTYLRFIRRVNDPLGAEGLPEIRQAFEFALDHIGQDTRSGPIWQEYITFLSSPKPNTPEHAALYATAGTPTSDGDAQDDHLLSRVPLRRAYHRALEVPTSALDTLWPLYERFETSSTTANAKFMSKRLLDEWRPRFQAARGLLKERTEIVNRLQSRLLPLPRGWGGVKQAQQLEAWQELIRWERKNPQCLEPSMYQSRVILTYEQALGYFLHYPELWLDFADWHSAGGGGGPASATAVLHRGRGVLSTNAALHFAAAEAEEAAGAIDKAREVYESLIERVTSDPSPSTAEVAVKDTAKETDGPSPVPHAPQKTEQHEGLPSADSEIGGDSMEAMAKDKADGSKETQPTQTVQETATEGEKVDLPTVAPSSPSSAQDAPTTSTTLIDAMLRVAPSPEIGTLAWIQFMRFERRVGGMMAARKAFLRARKWHNLGWEAFVASAMMEWAADAKDQIPRNIFELGLKTFLAEPQYVLQYVAFLRGLGDTANARSLFERALTATSAPACASLWDAYIEFEASTGTLAAVMALERRRRDVLVDVVSGGQDAAHLALIKYKFLDLLPGLGSVVDTQDDGKEDAPAEANEASTAAWGRQKGRAPSRSPPPEWGRGPQRAAHRGHGYPPTGVNVPSAEPGEPIRVFPKELAQLMKSLPLPPDGPVPDVDRVISVIVRMDFTPEGIEAHEYAAAKERRRQRQAAFGQGVFIPGAAGSAKRKVGHEAAPTLEYSDSESSEGGGGDGDEEGGADVYRRRMRARV